MLLLGIEHVQYHFMAPYYGACARPLMALFYGMCVPPLDFGLVSAEYKVT